MAENMIFRKKGIKIDARKEYAIPTDSEKGFPLLELTEEYFSFNDLVISTDIKERLEYVIAENQNLKRLRAFGLNPKQKILFCGLPGTGKTLGARIMSSVIGYPFVYVLFDSILSSFLGQTATNLRKIFDFIEQGKFVVLFDEFDIVGKKRDDPQEHGEVKRIVNNFMQMIDRYDGNSILIAATNHPQLLDTAIWRRFDEVIEFKHPTKQQRIELFEKYLGVLKKKEDLDIGLLAKLTVKYSAADIATICEDALRRNVICGKSAIKNEDVIWAIKEQRRRKGIMLRV